MLKMIFTWIYCMDFHDALFLLAVFTGLYYAAWARFSHHRVWKAAVIAALAVWTAAVVAQTVFLRTPGHALQPVWQPFRSYTDALKAGGQKELLRSNFMNAVLFWPAGLLLISLFPRRWKPGIRVAAVGILCTVSSAAIEFVQYRCHLGLPQTDDVIHNALGAVLGAAVFLLISKAIQYIKIRRSENG